MFFNHEKPLFVNQGKHLFFNRGSQLVADHGTCWLFNNGKHKLVLTMPRVEKGFILRVACVQQIVVHAVVVLGS